MKDQYQLKGTQRETIRPTRQNKKSPIIIKKKGFEVDLWKKSQKC